MKNWILLTALFCFPMVSAANMSKDECRSQAEAVLQNERNLTSYDIFECSNSGISACYLYGESISKEKSGDDFKSIIHLGGFDVPGPKAARLKRDDVWLFGQYRTISADACIGNPISKDCYYFTYDLSSQKIDVAHHVNSRRPKRSYTVHMQLFCTSIKKPSLKN